MFWSAISRGGPVTLLTTASGDTGAPSTHQATDGGFRKDLVCVVKACFTGFPMCQWRSRSGPAGPICSCGAEDFTLINASLLVKFGLLVEAGVGGEILIA